ncbi:E2 ligase fold family C protein [Trinickia sp. EG282A]|uniref:E2 ligase fold family C protein n=1 Tax=Trinickia sp. EG282A TaxID=3237013 RepID=UPI0034D26FA9
MALADYFERSAQAASSLIQGFDAELLAARLQAEVVGVAVDQSVESSPEGQAAVDLTVRLLARLYPSMVLCRIGRARAAYIDRLRTLALSINPKIEVGEALSSVTKLLVFGKSRINSNRSGEQHTWYVGSNNWVAHISTSGPVGSGATGNPLGAGVAACVAVANVFRAVFINELGNAALDSELSTSVWDLRPAGPNTANPEIESIHLPDLHLVGIGAIGNGAIWALSRLPCHGSLHVVDPEKVTDSNLQRYVMLTAADGGKEKATLARKWLKPSALKVTAHVSGWAEHVAQIEDYKIDTVLSAVDSAKARIAIQASLPRRTFNAWTQRGEAGVSRHHFLGTMACLACLYMPTGGAVNEDVLVARALQLPIDEQTVREVRRRLQWNQATDRGFLERVAQASSVAIEKLLRFENRPLRELYVEGVCGGGVMEFHQAAREAKAEVPMGFQSALAGILLVAELVRGQPLPHTVTQIDLLGTFPESPGTPRIKTTFPRCLCLDDDFIEVYKAKYPAEVPGMQSPTT